MQANTQARIVSGDLSSHGLGAPIGYGALPAGASQPVVAAHPAQVVVAQAQPVAQVAPRQVIVDKSTFFQPDQVPDSVPSTATDAESKTHHSHKAPTSTMDPNVPTSESAPTALPTNPTTHPEEQRQALKDEKPSVVAREVEKTKAEEREIKGEAPEGTIVHGLEDDRLYAMLRRFDSQITHVLHPAAHLPAAEPDLRVSTLPNLPSHSDILKSNLERCIAAVGPSAVRGGREAQRLMSWSPEERWRTGSFCASYFICWIFGYAVAGVLSFAIAIVCFPDCRRFFFPPASVSGYKTAPLLTLTDQVQPPPFTPPSATDPTNQKGDESLLGNVDGKTVHRSKAEQAEEQAFEATSLIQAFTTRLLFDGQKKGKKAGNANVGEKIVESSSESEDESEKPQGMDSADVVVNGEKININEPVSDKKKKKLAQKEAKKKRDEMVGKMIKATEGGLGDLADMMERFTNALSPPAPYPDRFARFKMAGAFIVPVMFLFTFVPPWVFARSATFFFGVGMWAQPLIMRAGKEFIRRVPNWQEMMDIRNSILSGVPTDAQLTLHVLRVAEVLNAPLPRPPNAPLEGTPKEAIKDSSPANMNEDDDAAIDAAEEEGGVKEVATKAKHKTKEKLMGAFKGVSKRMAAIGGDVSVDGKEKNIGTRLDKMLFKGFTKDDGSAYEYPARLDGVSGHIVLESRSGHLQAPRVSFVPTAGRKDNLVWQIDDIIELKKSSVGMTRLALGWVSGADVEGLGLEIRVKTVAQQTLEAAGAPSVEGETLEFTRVGRREQLFVRLISMGTQRWEVL
ncbi:hypothetical protein P7C73_g5722, partial [Tremellales sp. Uapishka_1]